ICIDTARSELKLRLHELLHLPLLGAVIPGHPKQPARAPVANHVGLVQATIVSDAKPLRRAAAVIGLGPVLKGLRVRVFSNGQHTNNWTFLIGRHRWMAIRALIEFPAVVFTAFRRCGLIVDLFPVVLADISDEEVAGFLVKMEHVGIAKTVGPDLRPRADLVYREALLGDSEQ